MEETHRKVKDVISAEGWNWASLSLEIPFALRSEIRATPFAIASRREDRLAWKGTQHGGFDLRSAYNFAIGLEEVHHFRGQWIWKAKILLLIQMFVWKCYHNSIGVKYFLARRGMSLNTACPLCHQATKSIIHALRDCPMARPIWTQLGKKAFDCAFYSGDFESWLATNGRTITSISLNQPPWMYVFLFAIWYIWLRRNAAVFKNGPSHGNLAADIVSKSLEYVHCGLSFNALARISKKSIR